MKLAEIRLQDNCPEWLKSKSISVQDEDVDIVNGIIVWKRGTWECGIWKGGTWECGIWEGGLWKRGIWEGGTWEDGLWEDGLWEGGIWKGGIWKRGTWEGGLWEDGLWEFVSLCKWSIRYSLDTIIIGCKTKSIPEWIGWLDTDEEYQTPRDSVQFEHIKDAILSIKFITDLKKSK